MDIYVNICFYFKQTSSQWFDYYVICKPFEDIFSVSPNSIKQVFDTWKLSSK